MSKKHIKNIKKLAPILNKKTNHENNNYWYRICRSKLCIDAITLDGLFMDNNNNHRIDVIKMNIQGAEGLVIEGAKKLLEEKGPAIFIEFWPYGLKQIGTDPEQLYDKLIDYGYKASLISYLDGSTTQISKSDIFPLADIESKKSLALYMLFEKP